MDSIPTNIVLITTLLLVMVALVVIAVKLRAVAWELHGKLKAVETNLIRTERRIAEVSLAVDSRAIETQNAIFLSQLNLHFPTFMGGWSIDTFMGKYLVQHIIEKQPTSILELGSGASTILIARTLQLLGNENTTHITVDHDTKYLTLTREYARANGLDTRVTWLTCPLSPQKEFDMLWYGGLLDHLSDKKIDLVVIDGPPGTLQKNSRYPAFPLLLPYFKQKVTVILDDAKRVDEQAITDAWIAQAPDFELSLYPDGHGIAVLSRE